MQLKPRWRESMGVLYGVLTPIHMLLWLAAPVALALLDRKNPAWQLGLQSLAIFCIGMAVWGWLIKRLYFPELSTTGKNVAYAVVLAVLFIASTILGVVLGVFIFGV